MDWKIIRNVWITVRKFQLGEALSVKSGPNDCNMPMQHIATLLGATCCVHLANRVAMCCDMLGVVGSSLKPVKFEPTTLNMSQHVATWWPNTRNMLHPTMLRYVALACCDCLAGALTRSLENFRQPFEALRKSIEYFGKPFKDFFKKHSKNR